VHVAGRRQSAMSAEPISLMMFSNSTVRAGVEEHIVQLLRGLDRRYFRLYLACTPELSELFGSDLPQDVALCPLSLDKLTDLSGAFTLVRVLRKHRVQILHSHMFRASLFASPLAWIGGVPVIVETAHGREAWRKGWKSYFLIDRFAAKFVDRTIAVSHGVANYLVQQKRLAEEKISVIPTAAALPSIGPDDRSRVERKRLLGASEADPLLLLVGRLEPQKGHRVLIDAMPSVLKEFPRAQLVLLGDGSLRPQLEQLVAHRALSENIRFVGYQRDVRPWFAAADVSVLPSFYEGLPMTVLESLAAGCPVVATAVDGTPEIVVDGETGLLVPPGDSERLAEAIGRMLRDRQFALNTARAGREFVFETFSVEKLISRTQDFYLNVWDRYLMLKAKRVTAGRRRLVDRHKQPS